MIQVTVNGVKRRLDSPQPPEPKRRCTLPVDLPTLSWKDLRKQAFLGEGGCGKTYKGLLTLNGTDHLVAIKVPRYDGDMPDGKEAKILQELDGAGGAPRLYGITREDPVSLVMELCPGVTLAHYFMKYGYQNNIVKKTKHAVHDFHRKGYAHRDLNLYNIMVDPDDNNKIHIIDAGSARKLTEENSFLKKKDFKAFYRFLKDSGFQQ